MQTWAHKAVIAAAVFTGVVGVALPAHAVLMVVQGNNPQPGQSNVLSNACSGTITGPATLVQGCLNDDHDVIVNFASDENISYTGGQATIIPEDGAFSTLTISLASGLAFQSLILNIDALNSLPNPPDGAEVTFSSSPGSPPTFTFDLDDNGQNFFTITGENFTSVTFTTNFEMKSYDAVADVKQVRLGPSTTTPVPEPGVLGLIGVGLVGLGVVVQRRRRPQIPAGQLCCSEAVAT